MYKHNKNTAFIVSLVMIISIVLSPFSVVNAAAPYVTPTIIPPSNIIKAPGTLTTPISIPDISRLRSVETPARAQGVSYEFQPNIKSMPKAVEYDFKPILMDDFASYDMGAKSLDSTSLGMTKSGLTYTQPQINNAEKQEETPGLDDINGIKYPPGSRYMVLPKSAASTFAPKANEIYIDEEQGSALKVLEPANADDEGNNRYIVETPKLTDIFKSYTIPKQDIKLTTGNIAYMAPGVQLDPRSGMPQNYIASADDGFISGYKYENNKHILNLTAGKMIFQYPSKDEREKTEEEKKKAEKEKFEGDWWDKEQGTDLRGVEDESSLNVEVKIKEGTIVIENPTFHADFDLNVWTTHVVADFYFDSKVTSDVTFEGDLKFNKTVETCIFGYDIDLGKVLGKEKSNKAFVGVFLVLGVNGKVHVEVRTITTGNARAGYAYKAFGYGFVPYFVGPYVTYRPSGFDMNFAVDGEIHATLACVPQVGVIIWGTEIGALQIWLGFKSDARFSSGGGGGSSGNASIQATGSLSLDAFGELVGYLFGKRYSIFYIDFPLYKGEWVVGTSVSGGGGDMVYKVVPQFYVTADAYKETIAGKIAFDTSGKAQASYTGGTGDANSARKPYANGPFVAEVWNYSTLKYSIPGVTDGEGRFAIRNPQAYDIRPTDKVFINIAEGPVIEIEGKKYQVAGKSKEIKAAVPFIQLDFNVDTFNDIITGTVSGKYSGPVDIKVVDMNFTSKSYRINAINGIFTLKTPINENTYNVWAEINFEGARFPDNQGVCRTRNLDALEINFYNDFTEPETSTATNSSDSGITMPNINTPQIIINAQAKLDKFTQAVDDAGNKMVRPNKIFGTVTNKGDMGWVEVQGDNYVRDSTLSSTKAEPYRGNVRITAIPVEDAVKDLVDMVKDTSIPYLPKPSSNTPPWTAATQAKQAMELRVVKDSSNPVGIRIEQIPTSAAEFEFDKPQAMAYNLVIEHEGLTKSVRYNPFVFHGEGSNILPHELIGPLQKAVTIVTDEKIDSIINPGDFMNPGNLLNQMNNMTQSNISIPQSNITIPQGNIAAPQSSIQMQSNAPAPVQTSNTWGAVWSTQIGKMELTQKGTAVTGTIMQGSTAYTIEGNITNGVFKGSMLIPSAGSLFGDIVSFEMEIAGDGKSISFRNFGSSTQLKSLNGTKALRQ